MTSAVQETEAAEETAREEANHREHDSYAYVNERVQN